MALEKAAFDWIVKSRRPGGTTKLLSLGYPDLLVDQAELGFLSVDDVVPVEDSDAIAKWHNWSGPIYDTTAVLAALDIQPTYIDIRQSRGVERVLDLNRQYVWRALDEGGFEQAFDIILDPGTLEHCFNIGQAFLNVVAMTAPGGHVIHTNPMSMLSHGFYNLCPTLYADFYGQNGWTVVYLGALAGPVANRTQAELPATGRIQLAPEVSSLVVARAPADWNGVARYPVQQKYIANPDLKA